MSESTKSTKTKAGPGGKRRRLNPAERRAELIEAALRVLRSRGPDNARVEDVTRAAKAAKGTFYLYFPSWNDLLAALRDHLLSTYAGEFRARMAAGGPAKGWDVLEDECVRFIAFVVELGDLHAAIFHGPAANHPVDPAYSADTLLGEMLNAAIGWGVCRPVEARTAAPLLFSVLHATADGIVRWGDREQRTKTLVDLVRAWLRMPGDEGPEADFPERRYRNGRKTQT